MAAAAEARNPARVIPIWMVDRNWLGSRASRATSRPRPPSSSRRCNCPGRSEISATSLPANAAFTSTSISTSPTWAQVPVMTVSASAHGGQLSRLLASQLPPGWWWSSRAHPSGKQRPRSPTELNHNCDRDHRIVADRVLQDVQGGKLPDPGPKPQRQRPGCPVDTVHADVVDPGDVGPPGRVPHHRGQPAVPAGHHVVVRRRIDHHSAHAIPAALLPYCTAGRWPGTTRKAVVGEPPRPAGFNPSALGQPTASYISDRIRGPSWGPRVLAASGPITAAPTVLCELRRRGIARRSTSDPW